MSSTPSIKPELYEGEAMSLLDHLRELRNRIIICCLALCITTMLSFPFAEQALIWLVSPLNQRPQALSPTDTIVQYFRVALVGGVAMAVPIILYQFIAFLAPALTRREKRYLFFMLPFALLLFVAGILFAVMVAIPTSLSFLQNFGESFAENQYRLEEYISFVTTMMMALGFGFETPMVVYSLAKLGVVSFHTLVRNIRWAFLVTAIMAAVLTPTPDPLTMTVVMVPLFLLYLLGVLMARFA